MLLRFLRAYPSLAATSFGLVLLGGLVLLCEIVFGMLLHQRQASAIQISKNGYQENHPRLGYRPKANFIGEEKKWRGEETVYEARYTLDALHRRATPVPDGPKGQFALFFGDSFTFGLGVADAETLPAHFAALAPGYRAYNYGFGGYGPQNAWIHAHRKEIPSEVAEARGVAIYTFILPQVPRAVGSMQLLSLWGKRLPCLRTGEEGLTFAGLFEEAAPWRCLVASTVMSSRTVRYLDLDWPAAPRLRDFEFVADILAETGAALSRQFEQVRFVVLLFPTSDDVNPLQAALRARNVEVLDYVHLLENVEAPQPLALGDGHPTGANYAIVAKQLAEDLALAQGSS